MNNTEHLKDNNEEINVQEGISNLKQLQYAVEKKVIGIYQELLGDDFEYLQNLERASTSTSTDFSIFKIKMMCSHAIIGKIEEDFFGEVDHANGCSIRAFNQGENGSKEIESIRNIFKKIILKCEKMEEKYGKNYGKDKFKEFSYEKDGIIISFGATSNPSEYNLFTYVNIAPTNNIKTKGDQKETKEILDVLKSNE